MRLDGFFFSAAIHSFLISSEIAERDELRIPSAPPLSRHPPLAGGAQRGALIAV